MHLSSALHLPYSQSRSPVTNPAGSRTSISQSRVSRLLREHSQHDQSRNAIGSTLDKR